MCLASISKKIVPHITPFYTGIRNNVYISEMIVFIGWLCFITYKLFANLAS